MNQPKRWLDSAANPKIRDLLRAGLTDQPDARALPRTAAALGLGAGVTLVSGSALAVGGATQGTLAGSAAAGATGVGGAALASASGGVGALMVGKWLAIGFLSGGVASAGLAVSQTGFGSRAEQGSRVAPSVGAVPSTRARARVSMPLTRAELPPLAPSPSENEAKTPLIEPSGAASATLTPIGAPPLKALSSKADPTRGALAAEIAWIDSARRALASGDVNRSLAELDAFERARKLGVLDREAGLLRIDALRTKGDIVGARKVAKRYLETFPGDAHAPRLREFLGGTESNQ